MQKHQQAKTIDNGKTAGSNKKMGKIRKQNEARIVGVAGLGFARGRRLHAHNQTGSHGQPVQFAYAWVAGRYKERADIRGRAGAGAGTGAGAGSRGRQVAYWRCASVSCTSFGTWLYSFSTSSNKFPPKWNMQSHQKAKNTRRICTLAEIN